MIRVFPFLKRDVTSGNLTFRYVIPERYRAAFGRREIKRSLQTADRRIAIPLAMRYYAEVQSQIQQINEGASMRKRKVTRQVKQDDFSLSKIVIDDLDGRTGKAKGINIDFDGDEVKELAALEKVRSMLGAVQQAPPAAHVAPSDGSVNLSVLCKKYREEKLKESKWTPKTADSHEVLHNLLINIVGNVESSTVTKSQARVVKETLMALPPNMDKSPQFRGKSVKQILGMKPKAQGIKTVIDKMVKLSSLFGWGCDNGYCPVNPFAGLKPSDGRRARDQKKRFSEDDLQKIFDPERYNKAVLDHFKFFVPLIALHTGARVNEIASLRVVDVEEEDGIVVLNLTVEAASKKTKSSTRRVPLHPYLMEVGFADYVRGIKKGGHERLFPRAFGNKTGAGDKMSDFFNRTFLSKTGIDTDKKSFHSFRHTFTDSLKQLDANPLKIGAITGHVDPSMTTGRYGKDYPMAALYEVVCLLDFKLQVGRCPLPVG